VLLGIPKAKNWQLAQYRQLNDNAVIYDVGGQHVLIASLEDIIRSKELANRPADHAALPELRALLARQNTPASDTSPPRDIQKRAAASPRPADDRPYGTGARRERPTGPMSDGCER
jgi:hypothetical protein